MGVGSGSSAGGAVGGGSGVGVFAGISVSAGNGVSVGSGVVVGGRDVEVTDAVVGVEGSEVDVTAGAAGWSDSAGRVRIRKRKTIRRMMATINLKRS
jgi:hypothetical protein